MPRLLVIAAEASADAHAAAVIAAVKARRPEVDAFGIAGPALRAEGVEALARTEDLSVMGLTEVLPALPRILGIMRRITAAAAERRPDVALLVDSPDLNLRMARRLKKLGIPVVYFVAPMVWAWRKGRIPFVARFVDRLLVILPFEEAIWREGGVDARYVGHPLLDDVPDVPRGPGGAVDRAALRADLGLDPEATTVAVLPGSRRMEVRRCLPRMLDGLREAAAAHEKPVQAVIPVAPTIDAAWLKTAAGDAAVHLDLHLVPGRAREVLEACDAAVVASGTAALEAALAERPMVVVYRVSWTTWWAGRLLVRTPFVSLPNLLAGRAVVPELLQSGMHPAAIADSLAAILPGGRGRDAMLDGLAGIRAGLGEAGAAGRVADEVLARLGEGDAVG
jgi:lipid-A-disaccharide synthase